MVKEAWNIKWRGVWDVERAQAGGKPVLKLGSRTFPRTTSAQRTESWAWAADLLPARPPIQLRESHILGETQAGWSCGAWHIFRLQHPPRVRPPS